MRGRTFLLIGLALGLSAVPINCDLKHRNVKEAFSHVPVVVAVSDLPAGTVLTFDLISQRSVPGQYVTSSVVAPDSASYVINQRLVNDLKAGDPVRWSDFATLREAILPKTRVASIEVDRSRALAGELLRKDHVDVLLTVADPRTSERLVRTLIQNAIVLGVVEHPAPEPTSVRLMVTPEEAEQLLLGQELGRFSLTLRSAADPDTKEAGAPTTLADLIRDKKPK